MQQLLSSFNLYMSFSNDFEQNEHGICIVYNIDHIRVNNKITSFCVCGYIRWLNGITIIDNGQVYNVLLNEGSR